VHPRDVVQQFVVGLFLVVGHVDGEVEDAGGGQDGHAVDCAFEIQDAARQWVDEPKAVNLCSVGACLLTDRGYVPRSGRAVLLLVSVCVVSFSPDADVAPYR